MPPLKTYKAFAWGKQEARQGIAHPPPNATHPGAGQHTSTSHSRAI